MRRFEDTTESSLNTYVAVAKSLENDLIRKSALSPAHQQTISKNIEQYARTKDKLNLVKLITQLRSYYDTHPTIKRNPDADQLTVPTKIAPPSERVRDRGQQVVSIDMAMNRVGQAAMNDVIVTLRNILMRVDRNDLKAIAAVQTMLSQLKKAFGPMAYNDIMQQVTPSAAIDEADIKTERGDGKSSDVLFVRPPFKQQPGADASTTWLPSPIQIILGLGLVYGSKKLIDWYEEWKEEQQDDLNLDPYPSN